ncbi:MAG: ATP-binding cassette domain-containing protein [Limnochordia bacterium]|jgi:ABC-2 type transport system ATP-binding protein|nr:ATP-binding cassette domain-containing protein [Limnochordia bacterium]MDD2630434.1 ATP-binding cassette domain-containing protein [Limnochordia bacterium]
MYFCVSNLSYAYKKTRVLHNVSFCGSKGETIGLIGANGAGKTTVIKNITGYLTPSTGKITLNGTDIGSIKDTDFPISYIPDTPVFYEELSLLEHLHLTKALYPSNKREIAELLVLFELEEHIHKIPSALSKGTRQKLMIAMALLRSYTMLLADEPFSGLDPKQIALLKHLFAQHKKQNKLVILSTHLLDVAENMCDRYVLLHKGAVLADGTKTELAEKAGIANDASMESIYLELVNNLA